MNSGALPVLHQLRFSHYNEKARWALDHKRLPHGRRSFVPGFHVVHAQRLWGGRTLPCLVLEGQAIGDSSAIIAELERRWQERPLYPEAARAKGRALELQAKFDRDLGPPLRSMMFHFALPEPELCKRVMTQGVSGARRSVFNASFPVLRPVFQRVLRADAEGARRGREAVGAALDTIEAELQPSGYLVGSSFTVADLAAAALLFPLLRPPEFQYELPDRWPDGLEEIRAGVAEREGFRWALGIWRRHRGESAAVSG